MGRRSFSNQSTMTGALQARLSPSAGSTPSTRIRSVQRTFLLEDPTHTCCGRLCGAVKTLRTQMLSACAALTSICTVCRLCSMLGQAISLRGSHIG